MTLCAMDIQVPIRKTYVVRRVQLGDRASFWLHSKGRPAALNKATGHAPYNNLLNSIALY